MSKSGGKHVNSAFVSMSTRTVEMLSKRPENGKKNRNDVGLLFLILKWTRNSCHIWNTFEAAFGGPKGAPETHRSPPSPHPPSPHGPDRPAGGGGPAHRNVVVGHRRGWRGTARTHRKCLPEHEQFQKNVMSPFFYLNCDDIFILKYTASIENKFKFEEPKKSNHGLFGHISKRRLAKN